MSQGNTNVVAEPQVPPVPAAVGTSAPAASVTPVGVVDSEQVRSLQEQLQKAQADADRLRGFQADYTWASQAGLLDQIKEFRQSHKNPAEFKGILSQQEQAARAVEQFGGLDAVSERLRDWQEIQAAIRRDGVYVPIAPAAVAEPPMPSGTGQQPVYQGQPMQVTQAPALGPNEIRDIARQEALDTTAALEREGAFNDVVEALAKDLTDEAHPPTPALHTMLRGAVTADLETLLAGSRPPTLDEIGDAGARVLNTLLVRARASGVALTGNPATATTPPLSNGAGPGGQLPAKPRAQMTTEEKAAVITAQLRQQMAAQGAGMTPQGEVDPNITFE